MAYSMTPQQFLEEVRNYAATKCALLGHTTDAYAIDRTAIHWEKGYTRRDDVLWVLAYGNGSSGATFGTRERPCIEMYAPGQQDKMQMAFTLVHELAHVITDNTGHGEKWAVAARMLGIDEKNYAQKEREHDDGGHFRWLDKTFEAFVRGLPFEIRNGEVSATNT